MIQAIFDWFARAGLHDLLGISGLVGYIGAYFLLQVGTLKADGYWFSLVNLAASGCILVSLSRDFNAYSAATEIAWSTISIIGLTRVFLIHHLVRFSPAQQIALDAIAPGLAKPRARKLLSIGRERMVPSGTELASEGKAVEDLAVLLDGNCLIRKAGTDVAAIRTGAIIGEMTYATGAPATATVIATGDCRAYLFPAGKLRTLLAANPDIAAEIGQASAVTLGARLGAMTEQVAALGSRQGQ